ncbi:hypothetical protein D8674_026268 [Pyrus ussuriensis x Pyrus communis]|uniref:Uncharacterized protein n=1 Tax=Pyrus ussuriensis x Pyrus communis TaxID=2448454 RepID=A0A5N5IKV7_9ROSA|nr:hypothetical protein D8674_026268 [Pyrus ussuriensis x Pyrus communis]
MLASYFGYLESVDRLAFSGQLVHELLICRVANQGVKNLEGLTYLIAYDLKLEPSNIRLLSKYFPWKCGFVGESSKGKGDDDVDVVMPKTLTSDTNDVEELKDIIQRNVLKKVEELTDELYLLLKHGEEARRHDYTQMTTQRTTRGQKPESFTPFLPILLKTMKGEGEPFSTSWLVDVEMNKKALRITVYDSLRSTMHSQKVTTKLAPISYVLTDVLQSMSIEENEGP